MRVVATLTTLPGRYEKLERTLISLQRQSYKLDAIYLAIPKRAARLQQEYPPLPKSILQRCQVVDAPVDYGPVTKLYGGVTQEFESDTIVVSFDDDVVYSPTLVYELVKRCRQYPQSAIGSSGILLRHGFPFYSTTSNCPGNWNRFTAGDLPAEGRAVDALCGFSAVAYRKSMFDTDIFEFALLDRDLFMNDDILISGYLSQRNIERRLVPNVPVVNEHKIASTIDVVDSNAISADKLAFLQRFRRSIVTAKSWGWFGTTAAVRWDETIGGKIAIGLILLVLILLLVWCWFQ